MVYGTLDLQAMVLAQGAYLFGWIPQWGIVTQPLAALLFLVAGVAETKRVPFDLPEGESEIIGYFVEYSGMKFGMFFLADFIESVLISALWVTIFFGGWQLPYLGAEGFLFPWGGSMAVPPVAVSLMQVATFLGKVIMMLWFLMLVRWTLPRFRYDQLMHLGWKIMFPLSIANIVVTAVVIMVWKL
jgi:NADH-quinone oxidoreductase subunit H